MYQGGKKAGVVTLHVWMYQDCQDIAKMLIGRRGVYRYIYVYLPDSFLF